MLEESIPGSQGFQLMLILMIREIPTLKCRNIHITILVLVNIYYLCLLLRLGHVALSCNLSTTLSNVKVSFLGFVVVSEEDETIDTTKSCRVRRLRGIIGRHCC